MQLKFGACVHHCLTLREKHWRWPSALRPSVTHLNTIAERATLFSVWIFFQNLTWGQSLPFFFFVFLHFHWWHDSDMRETLKVSDLQFRLWVGSIDQRQGWRFVGVAGLQHTHHQEANIVRLDKCTHHMFERSCGTISFFENSLNLIVWQWREGRACVCVVTTGTFSILNIRQLCVK